MLLKNIKLIFLVLFNSFDIKNIKKLFKYIFKRKIFLKNTLYHNTKQTKHKLLVNNGDQKLFQIPD
jgi:hypothetical protein